MFIMQCKYCHKQFQVKTKSGIGGHITNCPCHPNRKQLDVVLNSARAKVARSINHSVPKKQYSFCCLKCNTQFKLMLTQNEYNGKRRKKYCSRNCANSHEKTLQQKEHIRSKLLGKQYVTRMLKTCLLCGKSFKTLKNTQLFCSKSCSLEHKRTPEQRIKQSIRMTGIKHKFGHKTGGYRIGSTWSKGCWYQSPIAGNVYLDSSWELKYAKWLDYNQISWKRNTTRFHYQYENKSHYYIPDFYIIDTQQYVQIKGYKTKRDLAKWEYFPHKLNVLMKQELESLKIL